MLTHLSGLRVIYVSVSLPILHYCMYVYAKSETYDETLRIHRLVEPFLLVDAISAKFLWAFSFFTVLLMYF